MIRIIYYDRDKFLKELKKIKNTKFQLRILDDLSDIEDGITDSIDSKPISEGIYEFRFGLGNNEYRILYFYDESAKSTVILTHGFSKNSQKTPKNEIDRAKKIRNQYYISGIKKPKP